MSGSGSANIWMNRNRPQLTAEQQPLTMSVQQQPQPISNTLAAQFNAPAPNEQQAEEPSQTDEEDLMKLLRKYWSAIV